MKIQTRIKTSFGEIIIEGESPQEILKVLEAFPINYIEKMSDLVSNKLTASPALQLKGIIELTTEGPVLITREKLTHYEAIGLILYGSYIKEQNEGPGWMVPGTSDLDLILIVDLDDINPKKPPRRLAKIGETLTMFFTHPTFAPILDLTLLVYHDLPSKLGMSFSPIHAESAARYGEVLLGKNVLENFTYSEQLLSG